MKTHLTDERQAAILADLEAGRPYKEMMAKYGLSHYVINGVGQRAGLPQRGPGIRPPELLVERGQTFERWTVLEPSVPARGPRRALCECQCGAVQAVQIISLHNGMSRSCGCLKLDINVRRMIETKTTHGLSGHLLYSRWESMMRRCYDPDSPNWRWYGGRGIGVRPPLDAPSGYIAYVEELEVRAGLIGNAALIKGHDLSPEQRVIVYRELSIDRKDNDGDYEIGNLRWATDKEQVANSRSHQFKR